MSFSTTNNLLNNPPKNYFQMYKALRNAPYFFNAADAAELSAEYQRRLNEIKNTKKEKNRKEHGDYAHNTLISLLNFKGL